MRIIKHGNALNFVCRGCGCQWVASKMECKSETRSYECIPSGKDYVYNCPECGFRTVGDEIKADDVHEGVKKDAEN